MQKIKHKKKHRRGVPTWEQMDKFENAIRRKVRKRGTRRYRRHRDLASKVIERLLEKYGLARTLVATHYRLKGTCILIGAEKTMI